MDMAAPENDVRTAGDKKKQSSQSETALKSSEEVEREEALLNVIHVTNFVDKDKFRLFFSYVWTHDLLWFAFIYALIIVLDSIFSEKKKFKLVGATNLPKNFS